MRNVSSQCSLLSLRAKATSRLIWIVISSNTRKRSAPSANAFLKTCRSVSRPPSTSSLLGVGYRCGCGRAQPRRHIREQRLRGWRIAARAALTRAARASRDVESRPKVMPPRPIGQLCAVRTAHTGQPRLTQASRERKDQPSSSSSEARQERRESVSAGCYTERQKFLSSNRASASALASTRMSAA
jgi:hypothetical protein